MFASQSIRFQKIPSIRWKPIVSGTAAHCGGTDRYWRRAGSSVMAWHVRRRSRGVCRDTFRLAPTQSPDSQFVPIRPWS